MMSQFRVLYNAHIKEPELRFDEALGQPISDLLPQLFNIYRRAFDIEIAKSVQSLTCCPVIYEQDDFERFVSRLLEYNQQHGIGDNDCTNSVGRFLGVLFTQHKCFGD